MAGVMDSVTCRSAGVLGVLASCAIERQGCPVASSYENAIGGERSTSMKEEHDFY